MVPPEGDRANRLPTLEWKSVVADPAPQSLTSAPLVPPSIPVPDLHGVDSPMWTPPAAPLVEEPVAPHPSVALLDDLRPVAEEEVFVSDELPVIREATPAPELDSQSSEISRLISGEVETVAPASTGPRLPPVPQPDQRQAVAASPLDLAALAPEPGHTPRSHSARRRSRRGLKLFATLVVLGGLVAAGVVFGRPYLFPSDWDAMTAPYADSVETVRDVDFVEPLTVVGEPTAEYTAHLAADLATVPPEVQPQWRALGLLSGASSTAATAESLTGWRDAFYSPVDGQVYSDAAATDAQRDAQVVQAMTAAALDQELGWSTDQSGRTLDDRAASSAEVLRRSRAVQGDSEFDAPIAAPDPVLVESLPPVVAYELTAPYLFAEFDNPAADGDDPLYRLGTQGPGPLLPHAPQLASPAMMTGDDVAAGGPQTMDRSFWFLSFAAFLDPVQAHAASDAIVENSLTMAERGATRCVYATFSGGGVDATATLRGALEAWSAAAPAEFSGSFSALADGALQLVSCDPGAAFASPINPGAARSLLAWRTAELATVEALRVGGSTDLPGDFAGAWSFVATSSTASDLDALPASTTPAESAAAARAAVTTIFTPAG